MCPIFDVNCKSISDGRLWTFLITYETILEGNFMTKCVMLSENTKKQMLLTQAFFRCIKETIEGLSMIGKDNFVVGVRSNIKLPDD